MILKSNILIGLYKGTWDQRDIKRFQIRDIKYPVVFLADEPFVNVTHILSFATVTPRKIVRLAKRLGIKIYTITREDLPYAPEWKRKLLSLITPQPINPVFVAYGDDLLQTEGITEDPNIGWVFLDQYIGYDSENGEELSHAIGSYEKDVTEFLYKFPVVTVAGHPRNTNKMFGRYEIQHGITPELIKKSVGVIAHYSTAINYADRCGKPIIILSTTDLDNSSAAGYISGWANKLKTPVQYSEDTPFIPKQKTRAIIEYKHLSLPEFIENVVNK